MPPWSVGLGLTVVYTVLYSSLFFLIYLQLWLLLHYKQKRLSYQSVSLFACLLWAGLRTVLFSFYLTHCAQASDLLPFPHWALYSSPVCVQFCTLSVLNLYFSQVIFKAKCSPEFNKYKTPLHLGFLLASLLFLAVNLSCVVVAHGDVPEDHLRWITMARVLVNDGLFVACSFSLAASIFKIAKMSSANVYLESKGTSGRQAVAIGSIIILLYTSRACYDLVLVAISPENNPSPFNYGWHDVPDRDVMKEINSQEYLLFGIVLLFWELLPTCLVVFFFRAQRFNQNLAAAGMVNSQSFGSRAFFFDNPRRYDSDDDLTRLAGPRAEGGRVRCVKAAFSVFKSVIHPTSLRMVWIPLSE
ncbi:hypothetical protein FKM82_016526 [Ascaphus truei]